MNLFLSVILLNLLFVVSAIGKIKNFSGTVKSLKNVFWVKNLPIWFFNLSIVCVIILLLVAPSTMMYSLFNPKYNIYSKFSCYGIIAFTIMATLLFHFPTDPNQRISFLKNLSIIGGFFALSLHF